MTKQLVFIASGGRTGTQFFGDTLRTVISDCHSEHEPDMVAGLSRLTLSRVRRFGLWHMGPGRILGQTGVRVLGQRLLEGRMDPKTCAQRLRATRHAFHANTPQTLIVESYYAWWMVAELVSEIWPGAKLAGVIRDPRNWITSWQRHLPRRRRNTLTELLPPGPLTPTKLGDAFAAEIWPHLDQVGRLAWEWSLICGTLSRAAERVDAVRVFRYEDLFNADRSELHRFVHFVAEHKDGQRHEIGDLDAVAGQVRNASFGSGRGWRDWTDTQVAAVAMFCGPDMAAYGYGNEPEWRDRVERAGTL